MTCSFSNRVQDMTQSRTSPLDRNSLDVSELGVTLADFASQVQIAQVGSTTELQIGTFAGSSIIDLLNVNAAAISPTTDFKFV